MPAGYKGNRNPIKQIVERSQGDKMDLNPVKQILKCRERAWIQDKLKGSCKKCEDSVENLKSREECLEFESLALRNACNATIKSKEARD